MPTLWKLGTGTIVEFQGKDRSKVFNNLATQDLRELSAGQSLETFITDPKGRAFGHGIAVGLPETHWFVTVPDQASRLVLHFDRFIIMEDATVKDRSSAFTFWLASDDSVLPLLGCSLPSSPYPDAFQSIWNDRTAVFARAPWIHANSRLILTESPELPSPCDPRLASMTIQSDLKDRSQWESVRIENFWPWYGTDLDERNFPQELDRDATAISFRKGCYLGQETVARLDALGQVQKKLVKLAIRGDGEIDIHNAEATKLRRGEAEVGQLRSIAKKATGQSVGLGFVKRSHFEAGTELQLGANGHIAMVMPKD
jgi:folate-binding protein YgfZ